MAKTLIKIGKVFGKKDGTPYIVMSVYDDEESSRFPYKTLAEVINHPEDEKVTAFVGQNVEDYLIAVEDIRNGRVEIDGEVALGSHVRVFQEGTPARVTYIKAVK